MIKQTVCIVTGARGQDGSYLCEKLLNKGYTVVGVDQWYAVGGSENIEMLLSNKNFILETGDITEKEFIELLFTKHSPDYFYNMAAISFVKESFNIPLRIMAVNTTGVVNILETIKNHSPSTRFLQMSTSEQIGANDEPLQSHNSKMIPQSPYAISKLASYHFTRLYRESYGLFAVNCLAFNHESERRGPSFVTRKISLGIREQLWSNKTIKLGNIYAKRDWGYAPDFCDAFIKMMERDVPDDYTLATGETHTIKEFVEEAYAAVNEKLTWVGEGLDEKGINQHGVVRVEIDKELYRPAEVNYLLGDNSYAKKTLGWQPTVTFKELAKRMVLNDIEY